MNLHGPAQHISTLGSLLPWYLNVGEPFPNCPIPFPINIAILQDPPIFGQAQVMCSAFLFAHLGCMGNMMQIDRIILVRLLDQSGQLGQGTLESFPGLLPRTSTTGSWGPWHMAAAPLNIKKSLHRALCSAHMRLHWPLSKGSNQVEVWRWRQVYVLAISYNTIFWRNNQLIDGWERHASLCWFQYGFCSGLWWLQSRTAELHPQDRKRNNPVHITRLHMRPIDISSNATEREEMHIGENWWERLPMVSQIMPLEHLTILAYLGA